MLIDKQIKFLLCKKEIASLIGQANHLLAEEELLVNVVIDGVGYPILVTKDRIIARKITRM